MMVLMSMHEQIKSPRCRSILIVNITLSLQESSGMGASRNDNCSFFYLIVSLSRSLCDGSDVDALPDQES